MSNDEMPPTITKAVMGCDQYAPVREGKGGKDASGMRRPLRVHFGGRTSGALPETNTEACLGKDVGANFAQGSRERKSGTWTLRISEPLPLERLKYCHLQREENALSSGERAHVLPPDVWGDATKSCANRHHVGLADQDCERGRSMHATCVVRGTRRPKNPQKCRNPDAGDDATPLGRGAPTLSERARGPQKATQSERVPIPSAPRRCASSDSR